MTATQNSYRRPRPMRYRARRNRNQIAEQRQDANIITFISASPGPNDCTFETDQDVIVTGIPNIPVGSNGVGPSGLGLVSVTQTSGTRFYITYSGATAGLDGFTLPSNFEQAVRTRTGGTIRVSGGDFGITGDLPVIAV